MSVPSVVLALSGCVVQPAGDGPIGSAQSAALSVNALSVNALSVNALSVNALSVNALSVNALSVNALDANSLGAIEDPSSTGSLSRELLSYTVGCAFNASQSFSFSWTDAQGVHEETYEGQLGLAAEWATGSLSSRGQRLVSACLAARTNYFGVTVHISVRGSAEALQDNTTDAELAAYPHVEGAFWGNLFTHSPALYSCYDPANVAHSRAAERECATGYLDAEGHVLPCGPIVLTGSCTEACWKLDIRGQYYWGCGDSGEDKDKSTAITIGLQ